MTTQNPAPVATVAPFTLRLRETCERLNLSDDLAADYFGVPVYTVRKWITGERVPAAVAVRLLDVLGTVEALAPAIHAHLMPERKNSPQKLAMQK